MFLNSVKIVRNINMESTESEFSDVSQSSDQLKSQTFTATKSVQITAVNFMPIKHTKFAPVIPLLEISQKKRKACNQLQGNISKNLLEEAKESLLEAYKHTNQEEILQALKHVSHAINNIINKKLNQLINLNQQIEKTTQLINQIIKSLH